MARMIRPTLPVLALLAGLGLLPRDAFATWSIAATESTTGRVGGAIASCVGELDLGIVYDSVPGRGVVHAQAQLDLSGHGRARAFDLLRMGATPAELLRAITDPTFDPRFEVRQYGVVDLMGRAAGYSGPLTGEYRGDQQGRRGAITYSIQGNLLTGPAVLARAEAGLRAEACDLPERLMLALEAGAASGEGDRRCAPRGTPADAAFIEVDEATGEPGTYLRISVTGTGSASAVARLRERFDLWRRAHPCRPVAADAGGPTRDGDPDGTVVGPAGASAALDGDGCRCGAGGADRGGPASLMALGVAWAGCAWRRRARRALPESYLATLGR